MEFDHTEIRRMMDRDASDALFAALVDPFTSSHERDDVVTSLAYVDDPRLTRRLRDLVFAENAPDEVRLAAYEVVEGGSDYFTDAERRAVWELNHPGLARCVLGSMRDEDIVLPIATDPNHPLHARAVDALAFGFEAHQDLAIAALSHRDPEVRCAAVTTVLWEEPLGAVPGLLACLDDDDDSVRSEVENTLQ